MLHAGKDGLRVRAHHPDVAVEYHQPGPLPVDVVALPGEALDDFEGGRGGVVTLENVADAVQARWDDRGVPQVRDYAAVDKERLPPFPAGPEKLSPMDGGLVNALEEARRSAAKDGVRLAVQKLQLRGAGGQVVGTDGRQLLIQGGFSFPWKEDILVPAAGVFGCKELPQDGPVVVGRTDTHVCVRVGPWTFHLAIDKDSRFPRVEHAIPALTSGATTCRLSREDAAFLATALPRLAGRGEDHEPVTVDLNGHVAVRARAEGQARTSEVVLSHSEVVGPAVRFCTDRQYLARAVQLGFTEFQVIKPDVPVVCRDEKRTFVWVPLSKEGCLPPAEDALRIAAHDGGSPAPPPPKERRDDAMTKPLTNGHGNGQASPPAPLPPVDAAHEDGTPTAAGIGALITEAEALKEVTRDAYERASRLLGGLKRHRKQSKLVANTLASLRQLQGLGG